MKPLKPIIATMSAVGRPSGTHSPGTYRCECDGFFVIHKSPEHRLARKLVEAGYDMARPYQTVWDHGKPSLRWPSLMAAAKYNVIERDKEGLQKVIWYPSPHLSPQAAESAWRLYDRLWGPNRRPARYSASGNGKR